MASGVASEEEEFGDDFNKNKNNNKRTSDHDGGNIFGVEIFDHESDSMADGESSNTAANVTGAEMATMEKKLKVMKLEEKKLQKQEKYRRMSLEAEKVEKSIKSLKGESKNGKGRKKVTAGDLRGMKEVMNQVDRLMDEKVKHRKVTKSENSSSDEESSGTTSSEEEVHKKGNKKRKSKVKSGLCKSGKNNRITSLVQHQEDWPHTFLAVHFVTKEKEYEELTLAEFCAGYTAILENCSGPKLVHRLSHFKELMYLSTKYQWRYVLNYHAAVLLEIERGHCSWGDNFHMLQNTTLAGGLLTSHQFRGGSGLSSSGSSKRPFNSNGGNNEGILFCHDYQNGSCSHVGDHQGEYKGEKNRQLKHICAICWLVNKKMAAHPKKSEVCPFSSEGHS